MSVGQITLLGGPTALIEIGGLRLLTDPTFSPPGSYPSPSGAELIKITGPVVRAQSVHGIDAVLLSHDQHPDNLDPAGRELLGRVPLVISTAAAAVRLDVSVRALRPWQRTELVARHGGRLVVTAVPAQHGPRGAEALAGDVIGFVLAGESVPTVYVSGDNASLAVVAAIAEQFAPVDSAALFAGAARSTLFDGAPLTLTAAQAAQAARLLDARQVIGLHLQGWAHYSEGPGELAAAFAEAGLADRLVAPRLGEPVRLVDPPPAGPR